MCIWTGYGLFQIIGPRHLRLDIPLGLFVFCLGGVLTLGWLAFVAAELGVFSAMSIALIGTLLGASGWLISRRRGSRIVLNWKESGRGEIIFLIALIALMGVLYLRPHEFIFGGADAGVYVNLGARISRSGSWLISNPDFSAVAPGDYPMLFREQPPSLIPRYYHLPGFYVTDGDAGNIIPQFYPLHPVWLALAYEWGGLWASLFMTPLWGMLGVLALYFAVRESFDRRLAVLAAGLLALAPTQIWFARYPTSETLTQFLLFAGLCAFARHVRHDENAWAVLAGLALGQVMLVRADTYFLLVVLPVYAAYLRWRRRLDRLICTTFTSPADRFRQR
jgi:4-amino-4-deoxy-L-arabinose transferase-like glycosyltransferase